MKNHLKLIRVKHYIKNLLIFFPLVFSHSVFNFALYDKLIIGFLSFSLYASITYILNDIHDIEHDKRHEYKKFRPLASGAISKKSAYIFLGVILLINIILNIWLFKIINSVIVLLIPVFYLIINILYSKWLKHLPIIDVFVIAFGFFLRVVYGALLINVELSNWFSLLIIFGSLYMGFGKRRNELIKSDKKIASTREVLAKYNKEFLDKNMYLCLSAVIIFYSLWCMDQNVSQTINNSYLIFTVPYFALILLYYNLSVESGSSGDPVEVILENKLLIVLIFGFAVLMFLILYVL